MGPLRLVLPAVIGSVLLAPAASSGQTSPSVDNVIAAGEWDGAVPLPLSNGGRVLARRDGGALHVAVESPVAGFPHLCVGDAARVRVLHASAALGDAAYQRDGDVWRRMTGFEWVLRDSPRGPAPRAEEISAHLDSRGWISKASARSIGVREFSVTLTPDVRYFAVTFVETGEPHRAATSPSTLGDACGDLKVGQGFLPDTAAFAPASWHDVAALRQEPARSREAWVALREAKFAVPEGETAYGLLREMNVLVASTDPFLRDNVAYEAAARWIYTDGLLTPDEQRGILALWAGNLRQGLGAREGDAAFLRSFSALNLSIVAARDNREPFLSKSEFDAFLDAMLAYFEGERDTRGYDASTGWVHAAAHTADTLKFLARNSKLDGAQQARLLAAIDAKARGFGLVFQWAEDARIADVIVSLAARADFDQAAFDAWLATIPPRRNALWAGAPAIDPAAFAEVQNLTLMLRAALASLSMPAELPPQAAAARASIIATLRALR